MVQWSCPFSSYYKKHSSLSSWSYGHVYFQDVQIFHIKLFKLYFPFSSNWKEHSSFSTWSNGCVHFWNVRVFQIKLSAWSDGPLNYYVIRKKDLTFNMVQWSIIFLRCLKISHQTLCMVDGLFLFQVVRKSISSFKHGTMVCTFSRCQVISHQTLCMVQWSFLFTVVL
jgi:hypothetical protein